MNTGPPDLQHQCLKPKSTKSCSQENRFCRDNTEKKEEKRKCNATSDSGIKERKCKASKRTGTGREIKRRGRTTRKRKEELKEQGQ